MIAILGVDGEATHLNPLSIHSAAKQISDKYCSPCLLVCCRTVERWYKQWLAFVMLPCHIPKRYTLFSEPTPNNIWGKKNLEQLKEVIDADPTHSISRRISRYYVREIKY